MADARARQRKLGSSKEMRMGSEAGCILCVDRNVKAPSENG